MMSTNFGAAAEDCAEFRAGFPESIFERFASLGLCRAGTTVVDVGTGTGSLGRVLSASFPGEMLQIPHRVFAVIGRKTGAAYQWATG